MILERITDPSDLRCLHQEELHALASEIRAYLVESVALTGGHLGSNLGVVELTLALHRVFESPRDAIVWDTGHQAYAHKLVTGRQKAFERLRQAGGLSGYPSRLESDHDLVENSHASTALSYAHGLTTAWRRTQPHRRVVAVVGDGALTGGMAYEGLNNLGHSGSRCIVVLNDNGSSYAPTISSLVERPIDGVNYYALRPFVEALGLRYLGPVNGHDIAAVEASLREADRVDGPCMVHVRTRKGLGYGPAELDEEKHLHDVGPFDPAIGPSRRPGVTYTDVFSDALVDIAAANERVHAITAAMPGPTGLLPFAARFPERFHDVGIAEQHAVTFAAGLAMGGMRPVVAIYSTFLARAFDQVNLDVGLHGLPVVFALDRAGITGDDGPSHHGVLDLALALRVPGLNLLAPSSAEELSAMLRWAFTIDGPVAIRFPKGPARSDAQVGDGLRSRRLSEGADVCIVAIGRMAAECVDALIALEASGISCSLWDARCVSPVDSALVADALDHELVVTVEEGVAVGGGGDYIAAAIREAACRAGRAPLTLTLGTPKRYIPHGSQLALLSELGLDSAGIAHSILLRWHARRLNS